MRTYRQLFHTANRGMVFRSIEAQPRFTVVQMGADNKSLISTSNAETALSARVQRAYDIYMAIQSPRPTGLSIHRGQLSDFVVKDAKGQIKAILHAIQNTECADVKFLRLLMPVLSPVERVILISDRKCSMYDLTEAAPDSPRLGSTWTKLIKSTPDLTSIVSDICRNGRLMGNSRDPK